MQTFFQKNNKSDSGLFHEIEQACEGLIYISETDSPFIPFAGQLTDTVTADVILQQTGIAGEGPVEEREFAEFFDRLTVIKDWYGEPEKARAKKFVELRMLLEENLRELKVFRIGRIQLDIFAVGINKDGFLMGVTTKAVET